MNELVVAAKQLQDFCFERGWRCCFIGGFALWRWGMQRLTRDVDATLLTGFGHESDYIEPLTTRFRVRRPDAAQFALRSRVVLLTADNGIDMDVSLAALPYEHLILDRATSYEIQGQSIVTCSAEDLVILKLFAFRLQDLADVQSIVDRAAGQLDWTYIETELAPLVELKEQPEILDTLAVLQRRYPA